MFPLVAFPVAAVAVAGDAAAVAAAPLPFFPVFALAALVAAAAGALMFACDTVWTGAADEVTSRPARAIRGLDWFL